METTVKLTQAGRGESARMKTRARVLSEFPSLHAGKKKSPTWPQEWGGGGATLPGHMPCGRMWQRGHLSFYWLVLLGERLMGHLRQDRMPPGFQGEDPPRMLKWDQFSSSETKVTEGQELGTVWKLLD